MSRYVTLGLTVLAGAALFEVALIPGIALGCAVVLAPKYLPKLGRRLRRPFNPVQRRPAPAARPLGQADVDEPAALPELRIGQAIAKTITFRVIVTTLDFTTNYVVIGELQTAAGLSAFNLVAGPLFYLAHETAWNYFGKAGAGDVEVLPPDAKPGSVEWGNFTISRPLAKTITFRTIASVMDFGLNYVVVGEVATALGLSAFGFVVGPFVYFAHEKAWDHFTTRTEPAQHPAPRLLPAPAPAPA
jgi:uncharacterized membrane protein